MVELKLKILDNKNSFFLFFFEIFIKNYSKKVFYNRKIIVNFVFFIINLRNNMLTLAILKPDCVKNGHTGKVIDRILQAGFKIRAMKLVHLNKEQAEQFYQVHKGKPFFEGLIEFMTSGPCIPMVLEKDNAIEDYRKLIGATDPLKADDGTIRKDFAKDNKENCVHGSDSEENAKIEISFFFNSLELF